MAEDSRTVAPRYKAAQLAIDQAKYPPTHHYDVGTLTPVGPLREREERILELFPGFYEGVRFLDVGCSKGYFTLKAAERNSQVVAMDPDVHMVRDIWPHLPTPPNVRWFSCNFADLRMEGLSHKGTDQQTPQDARVVGAFDVVWLGNCFHYIHRDAGGYAWISRLLSLAVDHVVIEGPRGPETAGLEGWAARDVPQEQVWLKACSELGLKLDDWINSPRYTPGRRIWHLRRV